MRKALIIPGIGGTEDCWPEIFTGRLGSVFAVDSVTLPETGGSVAGFAGELAPQERVDLIAGFSMGAAVVQEIIAAHPDCAERAVLMAPPAGNRFPDPPDEAHDLSDGRGKWSASMLEMMFTPDWLAAHPDVSEFFPRVKRSMPNASLERQVQAIRSWRGCLGPLRNVSMPVLIIAGRFDIITPLIHAESIHHAIASSVLEIMDTGHGFPWQCPMETADLILKFAE